MFLRKLEHFQFLKKYINYIIFNNDLLILANTVQILIHKDILNLIILLFKKSSLWRINEIVDLTVVDKNVGGQRFIFTILFLSTKFAFRLIFRVLINSLETLESISKNFKSTKWLEREIFDMFGIFFYNNSDLRRILTDYGFNGFPLRKEFPVYGYTEKYYSISENILITNKISLLQEFRFDQKNL